MRIKKFNMKTAWLLQLCLLCSASLFAQEKNILDSIGFYGSLRAHFAYYNQKAELQNNASRIGIFVERKVVHSFSGFAGLELDVNLVNNNTTFNADAAVNPEISYTSVQTPAVGTRLGFVGIKSPKWGSVSLGKQWSVYYDVTQWTDNFWVFGGRGSGTYNTNSDGGREGTGRAENAVIYRYALKKISLGLQAQFNGTEQNAAASLVVKPIPELSIGIAANLYEPSMAIKELVRFDQHYVASVTGGVNYNKGKITAAFVYAYNQSEVQYPTDTIVTFPANGAEIYFRYAVHQKVMLHAGGNYLLPTSTPAIIDSGFRITQAFLGGAYYFLPDFFAYTEFKFDLGKDIFGNQPPGVFVIGLRYNFSLGKSNVQL